MDVRGYLHRDGSVIMPVSVEDLQNPQSIYQEVGGTLQYDPCVRLSVATINWMGVTFITKQKCLQRLHPDGQRVVVPLCCV